MLTKSMRKCKSKYEKATDATEWDSRPGTAVRKEKVHQNGIVGDLGMGVSVIALGRPYRNQGIHIKSIRCASANRSMLWPRNMQRMSKRLVELSSPSWIHNSRVHLEWA